MRSPMQNRIDRQSMRRRSFSAAVVLVLGVLMALAAGSAGAATLANDEIYRLPDGQVIEDNLYVTAIEI